MPPRRRIAAAPPREPEPRPIALPPRPFARLFAVSERTVWRWVRDGTVKTVEIGGRTFCLVDSVLKAPSS
jgi:hypothetical protein